MAKENTTVKIVLYKSKTLANGEHPLMVRITKNRKLKYISLGISCHSKYWNSEKHEPRRNHPNKDILEAILAEKKKRYMDQVLNFKNEDRDFTPDVLIQKVERKRKRTTVLQFLDETIERLKQEKSVGYSNVFKETKTEIKNFTGDKDLTFDQVDFSWLSKWETFFRKRGLADNTISIKFRCLRTLYNNAINEGYAHKDNYPFGRYKISKRFKTGTQKRAISKESIKAIEALELKPYSMAFEAQQYFLFSYYGQGINFIDIAYLKWQNIEAGRITYRRSKTGELISFKVTEPIEHILSHWRGFTGNTPSNYIFPILDKEKHVTATQQYNRTRKVLKRMNRDLKDIGKEIGLDTPLTSYTARHSFATILKQANVPIAIISETMGHQSEAVTKTYLKSFEDSVIDQALENL